MSFSPGAEQEAGTSAQETPIKGCLIMGGEPHQTEAERSERPELLAALAYCYFITHNSADGVSERALSFSGRQTGDDRDAINEKRPPTGDVSAESDKPNSRGSRSSSKDRWWSVWLVCSGLRKEHKHGINTLDQ